MSSVVYKVSIVLYNIILPWYFLLTKSALSFIISSCLGVFCCLQSQHCPLSYHLALVSSVVDSQHCPLSYHPALVSSVVDKVSTVLYHIIMPWCLLSVVDKVSIVLYHIILSWCLLLCTK